MQNIGQRNLTATAAGCRVLWCQAAYHHFTIADSLVDFTIQFVATTVFRERERRAEGKNALAIFVGKSEYRKKFFYPIPLMSMKHGKPANSSFRLSSST